MPKKPQQFFIVPDPKIRQSDFEYNSGYPYQGGPFVGTGTASADNKGDLQVYGVGRPTDSFDKTIRIQDGGSLGASNYIWKDTTDSDHLYNGEPDRRSIRDAHAPFDDLTYNGLSCTAFVVPSSDREVVVTVSNTAKHQIRLAYRSLSSSQAKYGGGGWTETLINLKTRFNRGVDFSGPSGPMMNFAVVDACTMEDGTAIIAVLFQRDFDIYETTDGINWSLRTTSILSRFLNEDPFPNTADLPTTYGRLGLQYSMKIATSGDFLRIAYVSVIESTGASMLKVISSSDKGSTWILIQDDITAEAGGVTGADRFMIDIVGLRNGQFMLGVNDQYFMQFRFYMGQGNSAFTYISSLYIYWNILTNPNNAPRLFLCKGADWVYAMVDGDMYPRGFNRKYISGGLTGKGGELNIFYLPLDGTIAEGTTWLNLGQEKTFRTDGTVERAYESITGFRGTQRYAFARGKLYNRGSSIAWFGAMFDQLYSMSEGLRAPLWFRFGGWEPKPENANRRIEFRSGTQQSLFDVRMRPVISHIQTGRFSNYLEWHSFMGAPAGILYASQYSPWSEYRSGATRNWNINRLRLTQYTETDTLFYQFDDMTMQSIPTDGGDPANSPRFNFAFAVNQFVSAYLWKGDSNYSIGTASGSCISFIVSDVSGGEDDYLSFGANSAPRGIGVAIQSYVDSNVSPTGTDQCIRIIVSISQNNVQIFDANARVELAKTNSSQFGDGAEYRLAFRPRMFNDAPASTQGNCVEMILAIRPIGSNTWYDTGILRPDTNNINNSRSQMIRWGVFPVSSSSQKTIGSFREFKVHTNSDLGTFDAREGSALVPKCLRGRSTSSSEIYLDDAVSVVWGGAGGSEGDEYAFQAEYTNAFLNCVKYDSPRVRWSSGIQTNTNNGTLITSGGAGKEGYFHNAFAVFGTNAKQVTLRYGSGFVDTATISMKRATGRVVDSEANGIKVEWDRPVPITPAFSSTHEGRKFFIHLSNVQNTAVEEDTAYLIDRHYKDRNNDHWIECAGVTMSFADPSLVGTTLEVYSDRGWTVYDASYGDSKLRIVLGGSTWNAWEPSNTTQELYAGSVIIGTTLSLQPVEMDWQFGDVEKSNVTMNKTRSGLTWGYREGPTQRTIAGSFQGDTSQQVRRFLRDTLRASTNFNENGLVFVLYDIEPSTDPLSDDWFMMARNDDNITLENIGWYYDEREENWRPVGNLSLTLTEIV